MRAGCGDVHLKSQRSGGSGRRLSEHLRSAGQTRLQRKILSQKSKAKATTKPNSTYTQISNHALSQRLNPGMVVTLGSSATDLSPLWSPSRLREFMVLIAETYGARHLSCLGSLSSSISLGGPVTKSHLLRWSSLAWQWGEERDPESHLCPVSQWTGPAPETAPLHEPLWLSCVMPSQWLHLSESLVTSPSSLASSVAGLAIRAGERLCGGLGTWHRGSMVPHRAMRTPTLARRYSGARCPSLYSSTVFKAFPPRWAVNPSLP